MDIDHIREAVCATLESIAPEADVRSIAPDRLLRDQLDLDSLDWINVISGLQQGLQVELPESDHAWLATLDSMVACIASRLAQQAEVPRPGTAAGAGMTRTRRLADGTGLIVRPMRADDAAAEADFVRHLSADSRYKRFMVTLSALPATKLKYLTDVDQVRHVALVATLDRAGQELQVGVARYVVDPSGSGCEFAVAVGDDWQGSGVAGILMQALMDIARSRGLARMDGFVLSTNRRMLKFVRQLGFSLERDPDDRSTVRVVRAL